MVEDLTPRLLDGTAGESMFFTQLLLGAVVDAYGSVLSGYCAMASHEAAANSAPDENLADLHAHSGERLAKRLGASEISRSRV